MALSRTSIAQPQQQAGILGISASTNLGGIKFNPRLVVVVSTIFILLVKIGDYMVASRI